MSPSSRRSPLALLAAVLAGGLLGFVLPHLRSARAQEPTAAPATAPADDDNDAKKSNCSCPTLGCTTPDGTRSLSAPCMVRCPEGRATACTCGKCGDDGRIETRNVCTCKAAE